MSYEQEGSSWIAFHRSGRGETFGWGLIFLWAAVVLSLELSGAISGIGWWDGWAVFFTGFGLIALIGAMIALQIGNNEKAGWNFFFGFIATGFGLSVLINSSSAWVFVLFAVAIVLIIVALKNDSENRNTNNTGGY